MSVRARRSTRFRTTVRRALSPIALFGLGACSLVNDYDPCENVAPIETRINERGDGEEFVGHPLSALPLGGSRLAVVFQAASVEQDDAGSVTSEVRLAILDATTGARITPCNSSSDLDKRISDEGTWAAGASIARADTKFDKETGVALVSWLERHDPDPVLRMRFINAAGCPLGATFSPYAGRVIAASVAWSEARHAVLAIFHDNLDVQRAWITAPGPASTAVVASRTNRSIYSYPGVALGPDGASLVAWLDHGGGALGRLLDTNGDPTGAELDLEFPETESGVESLNALAVSYGAGRYAVALNGSAGGEIAIHGWLRELATDGTLLGPARRLDPADDGDQGAPLLAYLPSDTLLATWPSRSFGGTTGRLLGPDLAPRFNAVSCDDTPFRLGARSARPGGWAQPIVMNDEVWVVHSADLPSDPRGGGVALWRLPVAELWPAER